MVSLQAERREIEIGDSPRGHEFEENGDEKSRDSSRNGKKGRRREEKDYRSKEKERDSVDDWGYDRDSRKGDGEERDKDKREDKDGDDIERGKYDKSREKERDHDQRHWDKERDRDREKDRGREKYPDYGREMLPRWKGKGSKAKALSNPMSEIISQLKSSFIQSDVRGLLSGCSVLVAVSEEHSDMLNRSCFGRPILTAEKDKRWFQLGSEEAFYFHYSLECLPVEGEDGCPKTSEDLWRYMRNRKASFPESYRAYSHLRNKNWVVRPGSQYGVDFVAYRHHPALVHSDFAVLVLKDGNARDNSRLMVWSDFHCTVRLCGSVAKQLLVLYVNRGGCSSESPSSISLFYVEERLISRWSPKECREDTVGSEGLM